MRQSGGFWWPELDHKGESAIVREVTDAIPWFLSHCPGRDCIVQAGGNVGVYPLALTDHFQHVYTVEPDSDNAACLAANLRARDSLSRVVWDDVAFGNVSGHARVHVLDAANCGAHQMRSGLGVRVITIDSLGLPSCDGIWLDVEGYELFALEGALKTIQAFSPVIACEEKGLGEQYGIPAGSIENFLAPLGYSYRDRHGNDRLYVRDYG